MQTHLFFAAFLTTLFMLLRADQKPKVVPVPVPIPVPVVHHHHWGPMPASLQNYGQWGDGCI